MLNIRRHVLRSAGARLVLQPGMALAGPRGERGPGQTRCEFKKGQIAPLFTPKMALPWSLAAPPTTLYLRGNLEFAIPELRAKADLCIKARALDAPTLRTRALIIFR